MPRHWFIKTKRGKAGPITSKMLIRLAGEGKIQPQSGISPDGESWMKAKHVVGLSFPQAEPTRWFVQTKGGNAGPFTIRKLNKLARGGRIRPDFAVSCDGENWIQAKRVPGIEFADDIRSLQDTESTTPVDTIAKTEQAERPKPAREKTERRRASRPEPASNNVDAAPPKRVDEPTVGDDSCIAGDSPLELDELPSLATPHYPPNPWAEQRELEYLRRFGPISEISRQHDSSLPVVDVYIHAPTALRPFTTLITSGMSDRAMPVPQGSCSPRAELVCYVEQPQPAYIELMRYVAQLPHRHQFALMYGSVINNGNPAAPIMQGSVLASYVFMIPNLESDFKIHESLRIENDPMQLLWLTPISTPERDLIRGRGMRAFCSLLDKHNHSLLLDPFRQCYVKGANMLAI